MIAQKKVPERTCLGCGQKRPKAEMLRIVKREDGAIQTDATGKLNGRGCYCCKNNGCLEKIIKGKKLAKSFSMPVDNIVYETLKEQFTEALNNGGV